MSFFSQFFIGIKSLNLSSSQHWLRRGNSPSINYFLLDRAGSWLRNVQRSKLLGQWFHRDMSLPPLAYSITRYKVFSVSITSKSLTVGDKNKTQQKNKMQQREYGTEIQIKTAEKSTLPGLWAMTLKYQSSLVISKPLMTEWILMFQGDSPMLGWFSIFMILTSRKSCEKQASRQLL